MQIHHENELKRRAEKLFNVGATEIETWETILWYGPPSSENDVFESMYLDIQKRFEVLFAGFYGDSDGATLNVVKQDGKTLFINDDLMFKLRQLVPDHGIADDTN